MFFFKGEPLNFIMVCVSLMNSNILRNTESKISDRDFPTEYVFQREFYDVGSKLIPRSTYLDVEVQEIQTSKQQKTDNTNSRKRKKDSDDSEGRIDFFLRNGNFRWGIEFCVLKSHEEVKKYLKSSRFDHFNNVSATIYVHFCNSTSFPAGKPNTGTRTELINLLKEQQTQFAGTLNEEIKNDLKEQYQIVKEKGLIFVHCVILENFSKYLFIWFTEDDQNSFRIEHKLVTSQEPVWRIQGQWEKFNLNLIPAFTPGFFLKIHSIWLINFLEIKVAQPGLSTFLKIFLLITLFDSILIFHTLKYLF